MLCGAIKVTSLAVDQIWPTSRSSGSSGSTATISSRTIQPFVFTSMNCVPFGAGAVMLVMPLTLIVGSVGAEFWASTSMLLPASINPKPTVIGAVTPAFQAYAP